jgi:hypothetical protein
MRVAASRKRGFTRSCATHTVARRQQPARSRLFHVDHDLTRARLGGDVGWHFEQHGIGTAGADQEPGECRGATHGRRKPSVREQESLLAERRDGTAATPGEQGPYLRRGAAHGAERASIDVNRRLEDGRGEARRRPSPGAGPRGWSRDGARAARGGAAPRVRGDSRRPCTSGTRRESRRTARLDQVTTRGHDDLQPSSCAVGRLATRSGPRRVPAPLIRQAASWCASARRRRRARSRRS